MNSLLTPNLASFTLRAQATPKPSFNHVLSINTTNRHTTFHTAKKYLKEIYKSIPTSFYCECPMELPYVFVEKCSIWQNYAFYDPKTTIEFDHLYPMQRFKERLQEKIGPRMQDTCPTLSRKCLTKNFKLFAYFESDMFNIRPVVKKLNRLRGTKWFAFARGVTSKNPKSSHSCSISFGKDTFSPPPKVRGDIARIMLHLNQSYASFDLFNQKEIKGLKRWSKQDPLSTEEKYIITQIAKKQGSALPAVLKKEDTNENSQEKTP